MSTSVPPRVLAGGNAVVVRQEMADRRLAVIDIEGCWEAQLHGEGERGCHLTTGTLAGFLGCLADYPVAVMEIECSVGGNARCRFLAGNADMLEHAYERVQRGEQWETIGAGEF